MQKGNDLISFLLAVRQRDLAIVEDPSGLLSNKEWNVGEFDRQFPCILKVIDKAKIVGVIEEANRYGVSVFPYSQGLNWGYGSGLPSQNHSVLLDLSGLSRIISIDEDFGVATIEPGVTQKQLADELLQRQSRHYLDVTGSGAQTSIIGNALERGIAYGSMRVQQIVGMEVVLGNGKQFRTGYGDFAEPVLAGLYPYGMGPSLDGLFFQSNLGIVLEAKIQLNLKPERMDGLTITVKEKDIKAFVDSIRDLTRRGYFYGIPHLADRERTQTTIAALMMNQSNRNQEQARGIVSSVLFNDWTMSAAVAGTSKDVKQKIKHIKSILSPIAKIYSHPLIGLVWKDRLKLWFFRLVLTNNQRMILDAAQPLREFNIGKPSDAGIQFLKNSNGDVDKNPEGFLLCTPIAPLSGDNAALLRQMAQEKSLKFQTRIAMTLNMLNSRVLEAVISIHFQRASIEETKRAHECLSEMTNIFVVKGFYPYRINIDQQKKFSQYSPVMSQVLSSIKGVLDPNGVIAPGRYSDNVDLKK